MAVIRTLCIISCLCALYIGLEYAIARGTP